MTTPAGPERFGDIVRRLFPTLEEPHMTQLVVTPPDALPSADDHYRTICRLLAEAEGHRHNLAEVHALVERVAGHRHAAELALKVWPAEVEALVQVLAAAQAFVAAEPDSPQREDAYERLYAAVKAAS